MSRNVSTVLFGWCNFYFLTFQPASRSSCFLNTCLLHLHNWLKVELWIFQHHFYPSTNVCFTVNLSSMNLSICWIAIEGCQLCNALSVWHANLVLLGGLLLHYFSLCMHLKQNYNSSLNHIFSQGYIWILSYKRSICVFTWNPASHYSMSLMPYTLSYAVWLLKREDVKHLHAGQIWKGYLRTNDK